MGSKEEAFSLFKEENIPQILPILPLMSTVVFPHTVATLPVGFQKNLKLIQDNSEPDTVIGLALAKNADIEKISPETLSKIGVAAKIVRTLTLPDGTLQVTLQGLKRIKIEEFSQTKPYFIARVKVLEEKKQDSFEINSLVGQALDLTAALLELEPRYPKEFYHIFSLHSKDPSRFADTVASSLHLDLNSKQMILETLDIKERLKRLISLIEQEIEKASLTKEMAVKARISLDESQRETLLRQQLREIKKELGEEEIQEREIETLKEKIATSNLPNEIKTQAYLETERLKLLTPASVEFSMIVNHLDWVLSLPWFSYPAPPADLKVIETTLNEEFYGLEKTKEKILDYLSVHLLQQKKGLPPLCFLGPRGVGKTAMGAVLARAMGRKFVNFSIAGVKDATELVGQKYLIPGAETGKIIKTLREVETPNPLIMIEDIDQLKHESILGGPTSALIEFLDPNLNSKFLDRYLGIPFDLSKVFFITTALIEENIPDNLADLLEFVEFPSLVEDEKLEIAKKSLIPKQFQKIGISPDEVKITDKALLKIIRNYTLEAGVRKLQGEIERISHKIARMKATGGKTSWEITENNLEQFLGTPVYIPDTAETKPEVGVVMGLAWTMAGGDIMLIEALKMPGSGQITSTGSLGEIIKESVVAALSYVRSRADLLGIKYQDFLQHDIHIHLPSGAVPKDGPSAGLAIALAIASVLSDKPVRNDLAVSGEISLRGRVLPVSSIREKVSAANRVGIKNVILPKENRKDLEELPQSLRKQMNFIFVDNVDEGFRLALLNYQEKKINLDFLASEIKKIVKREDKRKMKKVSQAKKGLKQAKVKKRGRRK